MGSQKTRHPFDEKCEKLVATYMRQVAYGLDTFRLPFGKERQERMVRSIYRKMDKVLNRSTKRINSHGEIEQL